MCAQEIYKETVSSHGSRYRIEMVHVKSDTFYRACTPLKDIICNENEIGKHCVILKDYYIGKYEVTQELWQVVMGYNNSYFKHAHHYNYSPKTHPVEMVTWNEVQVFLKKLNEITGKKYRLPTEAEWEFAANGGIQYVYAPYSGSYDIDSVCWYFDNGSQHSHVIGTKKPNNLGIYDMSGNLREWCNDWYDEYYYQSDSIVINPQGAQTGTKRVIRGGSWGLNEKHCTISYRSAIPPDSANIDMGFRLALDIWE